MTEAERRQRTANADALCAAALDKAVGEGDTTGVALVAVGGYGRAELAPHSDLDVVLVHDDATERVDVGSVAAQVWYPIWDAGAALDHAVRALSDATGAARSDPRVALGLLDARHVAGDPSVTLRLRADLLSHWRRNAREHLPAVRALVERRGRRCGELAHASVPDLKDSQGGLRDATVLKALVATWLVDVSHTDLEPSRLQLLDIRDCLQAVTGRATDRIAPELWPDLAVRLGLAEAELAQRQVRELGRRIMHLTRLTWRRVDAVLAPPPSGGRRAPALLSVAPGVAVSGGEVVLDRGVRPGVDPLLLLRASAEAAERGLALAPATAARLAREGAEVPEPWPAEARNLFTRLLAAGSGLLPVWETLDETGALARVLPEWERVRLLPHASVVHRFTVDRHLVETCIEASLLIRRVSRPDVLMTAALLHDIGKGGFVDHSAAGEPLAGAIARRIGFAEQDVAMIRRLVRWHLLLIDLATTRDLGDPSTAARVVDCVGDVETLDLLAVLTEADARATSAQAWTTWRAGLVADLVGRVRRRLLDREGAADTSEPAIDVPVSDALRADPRVIDVRLEQKEDGTTLTVVSGDRIGLMADVAGALAAQRVSVRSARAWSQGDLAVSVWEVDRTDLEAAVVRQRLAEVVEGRLDPAVRLRPGRDRRLEPSVRVHHGVSGEATVLEVRLDDRPGAVYLVCAALARLHLSVRSAHVATVGPQAVDVFYVQEPGAGALSDERAASAVHAVRHTLGQTAEDPVTLDADRG
ncbi:MAG: [protein-PII] uridylyltransferase [Nocardioidaceae bacterium]